MSKLSSNDGIAAFTILNVNYQFKMSLHAFNVSIHQQIEKRISAMRIKKMLKTLWTEFNASNTD